MEEKKEQLEVKVKMQVLKGEEVVDEMSGSGFVGAMVIDCNCGCGKEHRVFAIGGRLSATDLMVSLYKVSKGIDEVIESKENPLSEMLRDLPSPEEFMKRMNL